MTLDVAVLCWIFDHRANAENRILVGFAIICSDFAFYQGVLTLHVNAFNVHWYHLHRGGYVPDLPAKIENSRNRNTLLKLHPKHVFITFRLLLKTF